MAEKEKGRDENWEEREWMVEVLKSDPILKPYFEDGTFKVTNGPEKAIFELNVIFPIKKWISLTKRVTKVAGKMMISPSGSDTADPEPIPYDPQKIPPPGCTLIEDDSGEKFWIDPSLLEKAEPSGRLSDDQIRRIKAYKKILGDIDPASLEKTIEDFRRDGDPESEIRVWEKIARLFDEEVKSRKSPSRRERKLLLEVLLHCSMAGTDQVLTVLPRAKTLPQVKRVLQSWNEISTC